MSVRLNPSVTLLALAIIQPASASQVAAFLKHSLLEGNAKISLGEFEDLFKRWAESRKIILVHSKCGLYSLTATGNHSLTKEMRHLRDRTRLFLLKEMRGDKLTALGDSFLELADASSAGTQGLVLQEEQRPITGPAPRRQAPRRGPGYWPLLGKQLLVGSAVESSSPSFRFGSFPSLKLCKLGNSEIQDQNDDFNVTDLALGIGVSPRLISSFMFDASDHYRKFSISKKSGGERTIHAPRTMLKVVQYWILDYLLYKLKIHRACTSYQKGLSIYDNAYIHTKMKYVANFDIENFFPSITSVDLENFLIVSGFEKSASSIISKIVTLNGSLPQGAPTSPIISNAFLFEFDESMHALCEEKSLNYSRYADDITISGNNYAEILDCIKFAEIQLNKKKFFLNRKKTRVTGQTSRQVVTGLVVNVIPQPTRDYRRRIRAMFDCAAKNPIKYFGRTKELAGHLAYLSSFTNIRNSKALSKYIIILHELRKAERIEKTREG